MFIEIKEPKSVIDVELWVKEKRKENGGFINPDIVKEALSYTNNYANIKFLLKEISRLDSVDEKRQFRDVIFSMVTGRECSDGSIELMKKIAKDCGFEDALSKHIIYQNLNGTKTYHNRYPRICNFETKEELLDKTVFWYMGMEKVPDVVICNDAGEFVISSAILPSVCCFPNVDSVEFCNVEGLQELKCKEGAFVVFSEMNVPKGVDFEKFSSCLFRKCNFVGISDLKFNKGADVNFYGCNLTPFRLDLSKCKSARINGSDFSGTRRIVFKDSVTKQMFKTNNVYSPECEILTVDEFLMTEQMQKGMIL